LGQQILQSAHEPVERRWNAAPDDAVLKAFIKQDDWNDFHVIARGNMLIHMINGHVMSMFIDDDKEGRRMSGLIGIQLHVTPGPMKVADDKLRSLLGVTDVTFKRGQQRLAIVDQPLQG
jgi:hypothetical protein